MPRENKKKFTQQTQSESQFTEAPKRKLSGPIPGGRAVDRVIHYTESRGGRAFVLRVHYDFDKTATNDKERLMTELKKILKKLENN